MWEAGDRHSARIAAVLGGHTRTGALACEAGALDAWRKRRREVISARCLHLYGDEYAWVAYTLERFGTASLESLTDYQLERTYRRVVGRSRG